VLLPGAEIEQAKKMAKLLRREVSCGEVGGSQRMSMSVFGDYAFWIGQIRMLK
jgi:hypothetical protein